MKRKTILKQGRQVAMTACALLIGATVMQSCVDKDDEVLTGQPDWLGNSIYERLEEDGHYTTMLRLIDDMGQREVLSRTGSKTLFAADDNAFAAWYGHNDWKVNGYEDLTPTQKKLLVRNAMVNNAYLIELLSNISGNPPQTGMCMRRKTASEPEDTIPLMMPDDMPNTAPWAAFKNDPNNKGIRIYQDNSFAPMIHFLPAFMRTNQITGNDLKVLTNGVSTSIEDSWVDGKKIIESDITCKNGYIQKVDGVIEASPNMFDILERHADMSKWRELMNRFSLPWKLGASEAQAVGLDSVYERRFFANITRYGKIEKTQDGSYTSLGTLKYDPGWNGYYNMGSTMAKGISNDAGAMLVPTNEAVDYWWNHDGYALQEKYKEWDSIPEDILAELINVNMLTSFVNSVPSKFPTVLDDANMELGITENDIDSCYMGCNGVVYKTKRVFTPRAYSSVSFPATVHKDVMSIIAWAIKNLDFSAYLNSMDSRYSLFIPSNTSMLTYIDPVSFGESPHYMWTFYYDPSQEEASRVRADRRNVTIDYTTGAITVGKVIGEASTAMVKNRLTDLMEQLIVVGDVEDGKTYYKTKGGSVLKVENAGQSTMTIQGGFQMENNWNVPVSKIYDMTKGGNGKTYTIEGIPLGATKSVYNILKEHPEFERFYQLISGNDADSTKYNLMANKENNYVCANNKENFNVRLFEKYNYTVYVPDSTSIKELIDQKYLPTWDDYDNQTLEVWNDDAVKRRKARAAIRQRIFNFVRYHIQDRSVYIGGDPVSDTRFESSKLNLQNNRFYTLLVNADDNSMSVTDQLNVKHDVDTSNGLYNLTAKEYWLSGSGTGRSIASTSDAVIHAIKGTLLYDNSLKAKTWVEELDEIKNE